MPHFTLQVTAGGPILSATVWVSAPRQDALRLAGQPFPKPVPIQALVDTGASHTCIDPSVLAALGLTPTGSVLVATPSTGSSPHKADQYDVSLLIPGAHQGHAPLIIPTLSVTESILHGQGFDALIGRDILGNCLLHYNGMTGMFTLAF